MIDPKKAEQIMLNGLAFRRLEAWRLENPEIRWWIIDGPVPYALDEWEVNLHCYAMKPVPGYANTLPEAVDAALLAWEGEA